MSSVFFFLTKSKLRKNAYLPSTEFEILAVTNISLKLILIYGKILAELRYSVGTYCQSCVTLWEHIGRVVLLCGNILAELLLCGNIYVVGRVVVLCGNIGRVALLCGNRLAELCYSVGTYI